MSVEIFIPKNPIETAQELQWEIDLAHPEIAPEIARRALDVLGNVRQIYGGNRLHMHTLGAHILERGRSSHETVHIVFNELLLTGYFGSITYVQGTADSHLQTLAVDMFDVHILDPYDPTDPNKGKLRAPLTIPVNDIQSVFAAA